MKLSTIQSTLSELDLRPSKNLGQNFLHDQNLAQWIVAQLDLKSIDHLVEIGPGLGALTEFAIQQCRSATLIEKDSRLAEYLKNRFTEDPVDILHEDAMDFDIRTLFKEGSVKVLGNLPYYVSSQILFKFTAEPSPAQLLIFTIQRELAQRLSATPATKDYGALTLIIQRRWRVKYLRVLPASVFVPEPKVDSAVVSLTPRDPDELPECNGDFFNALVKQGFSQRRKQLRKLLTCNLDDQLPVMQKLATESKFREMNWSEITTELQVPETVRGEELSLSQWIRLTNLIYPENELTAQNIHDEIFDVVNDQDQVVATASRYEVHNRKLFHRAVHIFVCNNASELFLQKRSRWKDVHPLKWDSSAAGHVDSGQQYDETALRELHEELGIVNSVKLICKLPASENTGYEFVHLYQTIHEGPFKIARAEIECGSFFSMPVIKQWIELRPEDFASGFIECFNLFRKSCRIGINWGFGILSGILWIG